jgi:hypothetical protein
LDKPSGPDKLSSTDKTSGWAINAPSHNLPAATSILPQHNFAPRSTEEKHGEKILQKLVQYQRYDGYFKFNSDNVIVQILGQAFLPAIGAIQARISASRFLAGDIATTVAIMALLVQKFRFCEDLWSMIHAKAEKWLNRQLGIDHLAEKEALLEVARSHIERYELPKDPLVASPPFNPSYPHSRYQSLFSRAAAKHSTPTTSQPLTSSTTLSDPLPEQQATSEPPTPRAEGRSMSSSLPLQSLALDEEHTSTLEPGSQDTRPLASPGTTTDTVSVEQSLRSSPESNSNTVKTMETYRHPTFRGVEENAGIRKMLESAPGEDDLN